LVDENVYDDDCTDILTYQLFRMPLTDQPPVYRSYLLRLWEERGEKPALRMWRCSLEDPLTGDRQGFANLGALVEWLSAELAKPAPGPGAGGPSRGPELSP
jgi:hypothetical protein